VHYIFKDLQYVVLSLEIIVLNCAYLQAGGGWAIAKIFVHFFISLPQHLFQFSVRLRLIGILERLTLCSVCFFVVLLKCASSFPYIPHKYSLNLRSCIFLQRHAVDIVMFPVLFHIDILTSI